MKNFFAKHYWKINNVKRGRGTLDGVAQLMGVSYHKQTSSGFDSWSECMWEEGGNRSMFLSPSLPSPFSQINKHVFRGGLKRGSGGRGLCRSPACFRQNKYQMGIDLPDCSPWTVTGSWPRTPDHSLSLQLKRTRPRQQHCRCCATLPTGDPSPAALYKWNTAPGLLQRKHIHFQTDFVQLIYSQAMSFME